MEKKLYYMLCYVSVLVFLGKMMSESDSLVEYYPMAIGKIVIILYLGY